MAEVVPTETYGSGQSPHSPNSTYDWRVDPLPLLNTCHIQLQRAPRNGSDKLSVKQATSCQMTPCVKKHSYSINDGIPNLKTVGSRRGSWYFNATGLEVITNGTSTSYSGLTWGDNDGINGRVVDSATMARFPTNYALYPDGYFDNANVLFGEIRTGARYTRDAGITRDGKSNSTSLAFGTQNLEWEEEDSYNEVATTLLKHIIKQGGLPWAVPRLASHLSKYIRERANIPVKGRVIVPITVTEVRWKWIVLPILTWTLGAGFVLISVWVCRGDQPLWKNSSLPLIYHGFEADVMEDINAGADKLELASSMQNSAKTIYAQFQKSPVDGQLRLVRTFDKNDESQ
ncbi:hypothetical protein F5Y18DRAFT_50051 [Xylariaceae sp. FL1019]|nr:hypothetical protein F5Y18DRAFT_50051 [Xylariaceae sp. FL1019]